MGALITVGDSFMLGLLVFIWVGFACVAVMLSWYLLEDKIKQVWSRVYRPKRRAAR